MVVVLLLRGLVVKANPMGKLQVALFQTHLERNGSSAVSIKQMSAQEIVVRTCAPALKSLVCICVKNAGRLIHLFGGPLPAGLDC